MNIISALLATIFGVILGVCLVGFSWDTPTLKEEIKKCEAPLTRSEHCVLVATPELKGEKK